MHQFLPSNPGRLIGPAASLAAPDGVGGSGCTPDRRFPGIAVLDQSALSDSVPDCCSDHDVSRQHRQSPNDRNGEQGNEHLTSDFDLNGGGYFGRHAVQSIAPTFECSEDQFGRCINPAHGHQATISEYCAKFGHAWQARWTGRELRDFVCRRCGTTTDWVDPR